MKDIKIVSKMVEGNMIVACYHKTFITKFTNKYRSFMSNTNQIKKRAQQKLKTRAPVMANPLIENINV